MSSIIENLQRRLQRIEIATFTTSSSSSSSLPEQIYANTQTNLSQFSDSSLETLSELFASVKSVLSSSSSDSSNFKLQYFLQSLGNTSSDSKITKKKHHHQDPSLGSKKQLVVDDNKAEQVSLRNKAFVLASSKAINQSELLISQLKDILLSSDLNSTIEKTYNNLDDEQKSKASSSVINQERRREMAERNFTRAHNLMKRLEKMQYEEEEFVKEVSTRLQKVNKTLEMRKS